VTTTAFLGTDIIAGISVSYRSEGRGSRNVARVRSIEHCCTLTLPLSRFDSWSIVRSATRMLLLTCASLLPTGSSREKHLLSSSSYHDTQAT
jgi:hypothetical protein